MNKYVWKSLTILVSFSLIYLIVLPNQVYVASSWSFMNDHDKPGLKYGVVKLLKDGDYFTFLKDTIDSANSEIVLAFFLFKTNGYRSNYSDRVLNHLIKAARRGVKVTIILEREKNVSSRLSRDNRETARRLKKEKIIVLFDSPRVRTHTKVVVIDRRYTFVGSHNLTTSALKYNHELSVLVDSPIIAEETLQYVDSISK